MTPESHEHNGWKTITDAAAGRRAWIGGNDLDARRAVETNLAHLDLHRPPTGPIDLAIITPASADEAGYFLEKLRPRLEHNAQAWIVYQTTKPTTPPPQPITDELAEVARRAGFRPSLPHVIEYQWHVIHCVLEGTADTK